MPKDVVFSITLKGLYKRYDTAQFDLNIDHLEFNNNGIHVIAGPNGSGKSTLLKLIAHLEKPDEGSVLFNGPDMSHYNNGDSVFRKRIGFLMQNPHLFNMNVFENIALGLRIRRYGRSGIVSKVNSMMAVLNISHLAKRSVKRLSQGEYQKVAIGQILVLEPDVILMDEPAASIDKESTLSVEEIIKSIQDKVGSIVIMTTHSLDQAHRISPDLTYIQDGRIINATYKNPASQDCAGILFDNSGALGGINSHL